MRALVALMLAGLCAATAASAHPREELFTRVFPLSRCGGFSSTGENEYWVLQPGHTLTFEGDDDGELVELVITVLDQTITIAGVETRIVEERGARTASWPRSRATTSRSAMPATAPSISARTSTSMRTA